MNFVCIVLSNVSWAFITPPSNLIELKFELCLLVWSIGPDDQFVAITTTFNSFNFDYAMCVSVDWLCLPHRSLFLKRLIYADMCFVFVFIFFHIQFSNLKFQLLARAVAFERAPILIIVLIRFIYIPYKCIRLTLAAAAVVVVANVVAGHSARVYFTFIHIQMNTEKTPAVRWQTKQREKNHK